ncbi:MAG: MarR family winged helix-turn-helix transcriptional regulator [Dehalococcoidia bacterium]
MQDSARLTRFRGAYWQAMRDLDVLRLRQWEQSRVTLPQLRVLYQVRRTPGITTGELARLLGITVSTTSGLVIKLVDRGLIARTTAADDRRQAPLSLTDEGQDLVGELADSGRAFLNRVAAGLGDNLDQVTTAIEQVVAASASVRAVDLSDAEPTEPDVTETAR